MSWKLTTINFNKSLYHSITQPTIIYFVLDCFLVIYLLFINILVKPYKSRYSLPVLFTLLRMAVCVNFFFFLLGSNFISSPFPTTILFRMSFCSFSSRPSNLICSISRYKIVFFFFSSNINQLKPFIFSSIFLLF